MALAADDPAGAVAIACCSTRRTLDADERRSRAAVAQRLDQQPQALRESDHILPGRWYGFAAGAAPRRGAAGARAAKPLMTLPCSRSSAARRGKPARRLSSAGSPAWMPVTRASANTSATSAPARRRAKASIDSSPSLVGAAAEALRQASRACRASSAGRCAGTRARLPGSGASRPSRKR